MGMRIAVLGGAGDIGRNAVRFMLAMPSGLRTRFGHRQSGRGVGAWRASALS
jgi:uncharacterized protein YbjT (DUF2867 family)